MTTLCIVGNGFDLWHGLPTSYDDFYNFSSDELDEVESYYDLDLDQGGPWHDFETSLGKFVWGEFYDAHNHIDASADYFRLSFIYCLEDDLSEQADNLVDLIKSRFHDWIDSIDISSAVGRVNIPTNALFISFNYTSTLERIYDVDSSRVLHIHGMAEAFDDLVFGHGETWNEEPDLDENGESNRTPFSNAEGAAKYPFYAFQKPVMEIIQKREEFFSSLVDVTEVLVIGHSLNQIDMPYFKKIASCAPAAKWRVCCYDTGENAHHLKQLTCCGVREDAIKMFSYNEL